MKVIHKILFVLLLVIFILPGIQMYTNFIDERPLNGVSITQEMPGFNKDHWFSFKYQQQMDRFVDQNFGFRPFFIRLFNQVDFSVFRRSHAAGVVIGKQNYLFEDWYITAYTGGQYTGREKIIEKVAKLSKIKDFLKNHNTQIFVTLAAGKGHYYPEYIPSHYPMYKHKTDYDHYHEIMRDMDIPYIDVNDWFLQMKDTISYPLFSQTGTHWSDYGATLVSDSMLNQIEGLLGKQMGHFKWQNIELSDKPRNADNDLEKLLNIFTKISEIQLAYPELERDTIHRSFKPSAIVIADSFFWQLFDGPFKWSFNEIKYWYYFNSIYPDSFEKGITTHEIDIMEHIKSTDLVILLVSTANLKEFGFGFVETVDSLIQVNNSINLPDSISTSNLD